MSSGKAKRRRSFNTIGFRLTLWGAGITIVICFVVCAILYAGLWLSLRHEVDGFLDGEVHELTASAFEEHGHDYQAAERSIGIELGHRLRGDLSFRLLNDRGDVLVDSDPHGRLRTVQLPSPEGISGPSMSFFKTITVPDDEVPDSCVYPAIRRPGWPNLLRPGRIPPRSGHRVTDDVPANMRCGIGLGGCCRLSRWTGDRQPQPAPHPNDDCQGSAHQCTKDRR